LFALWPARMAEAGRSENIWNIHVYCFDCWQIYIALIVDTCFA
jgi:hypothetical protein